MLVILHNNSHRAASPLGFICCWPLKKRRHDNNLAKACSIGLPWQNIAAEARAGEGCNLSLPTIDMHTNATTALTHTNTACLKCYSFNGKKRAPSSDFVNVAKSCVYLVTNQHELLDLNKQLFIYLFIIVIYLPSIFLLVTFLS